MTAQPLRAGIIAAGRGERLKTDTPKPLVRIGGRTLIERVLTSIAEAGASEVAIIINEDSQAVRTHVSQLAWPFGIRWIVETTPSSMHSFLRVVETLASGDSGPFLVSTVDTVVAPGDVASFMEQASRTSGVALTLALTSHIDDEKPLHVQVDGARVVALGDAARQSPYVTAGYYAVSASVLAEAAAARRDDLQALRAFFGCLFNRGYRIEGIPVAEAVDVDRSQDVEVAEAFLRRVAR